MCIRDRVQKINAAAHWFFPVNGSFVCPMQYIVAALTASDHQASCEWEKMVLVSCMVMPAKVLA